MNFLNYPNWIIEEVREGTRVCTVWASYAFEAMACPKCNVGSSFLIKFGVRVRFLKDAPIRGKIVCIYLSIQRYRCRKCRAAFCVDVPEVKNRSRFTRRLVEYIKDQSIGKGFLTVAEETGVSEGTVREIFTRRIENISKAFFDSTPVVLGIDEVYVKRIARCILTDIERKRVIELLPKRDMLTVSRHLRQLQNPEKVKFVTMDMWRPFRTVINDVFPWAKIVIDRFHVQRLLNQGINVFLKRFRDSLSPSERRIYLRKRFVLFRSNYKLKPSQRRMLDVWLRMIPSLRAIYQLKEDFLPFWRCRSHDRAQRFYEAWRLTVPQDLKYVFRKITTAFSDWGQEIFNYFDFRVTNAFTESANNLIKTMQRSGRSYSYEVIRVKILYKDFVDDDETERDSPEQFDQPISGLSKLKRLRRSRIQRDVLFNRFNVIKDESDRLGPYLKYTQNDKYL